MSKFAWFVFLTLLAPHCARVGTAANVTPLELEASASSVDWPQFRGPTGQGIAGGKKMPLHWNCRADGSCSRNVVWKQSIPGSGWSSPIVVAGRVYLTTAVSAGPGLSLRAICLNADDGTILWNEEVFAKDKASSQIHSKNSEASPTPLLEGDRLYLHFGHHGTACLDLSGKVLWRNSSLTYPPVHGNGGSPVIAGNALIFSADGASDPFVVALNKANGEVFWKVPRQSDASKKFSFSTPLVIQVKGKTQVVTAGSNVISGLDPESGAEIWRVRYDGYSVVPRPVYGQGLIFMSTGFDHPQVLAIRPDGAGDVTSTHVQWSSKRGAPNTPSLLLVGTELYLASDNGVVSCLDAKTGKVHWDERIAGRCSASPVYADGKIYIQTEEGVGVVLRAGQTFQKLAENDLQERTLASCAMTPGAIYIRGQTHLFKIQDPEGR